MRRVRNNLDWIDLLMLHKGFFLIYQKEAFASQPVFMRMQQKLITHITYSA